MKDPYIRVRFNYEAGFSLISGFGCLTYLTYLTGQDDGCIYAFYMFNASTTFIVMIFIMPNISNLTFDENRRKVYHKYTLFIFLFVLSIKMAMTLSSGSMDVVEYQMIWTLANYGFYADFLLIMRGGLKSRFIEKRNQVFERNIADQDPFFGRLEDPEDVPEPEFPENLVMKSQELLKCKSCDEFYTENHRIPTILTKCGHSICKECCESIFREKRDFYVTCPVCWKDTYVNDSIEVLPKNYAVIAMLQMAQKN